LAVASCFGSLSVAVENGDEVQYLLRVQDLHHRAWIVPPGSSGIGPQNDGSDRRFVFISGMDCSEIGRYGLDSGSITLHVAGGMMADPDLSESIDPALPLLVEVADPCP
jgi:hypothetical protein